MEIHVHARVCTVSRSHRGTFNVRMTSEQRRTTAALGRKHGWIAESVISVLDERGVYDRLVLACHVLRDRGRLVTDDPRKWLRDGKTQMGTEDWLCAPPAARTEQSTEVSIYYWPASRKMPVFVSPAAERKTLKEELYAARNTELMGEPAMVVKAQRERALRVAVIESRLAQLAEH